MAGVTLSKCAEKGLYSAAFSVCLNCLCMSKQDKVSHIFIAATGNFIGITAGNYAVRNDEFFNDWEEEAKAVAIYAIAFFSAAAFWMTASLFDKTIDVQATLANKAFSLFLGNSICGTSFLA